MIIKQSKVYKNYSSEVCGLLTEVLNTSDFENVSIVVATDMKPSKGHFHKISTEIYWIYKGKVRLNLYDEDTQIHSNVDLDQGDLIVITPNIHHKITNASDNNKLIVISSPRWKKEDEYLSRKV